MKQVPDRRRLRRQYLRKKSWAYVKMVMWTAVMLPSAALAFLLVFFVVAALVSHDKEMRAALPIVSIFDLILWLLTWLSVRAIIKTEQRADALPYSPPANRADLLPAEEVLVRGVEEPSIAQSGVLLRAAQQGQELAKEELLRVSQE